MGPSASNQSLRNTFILDIFRGLAALYVLIGHARWLLWEGYAEGFHRHPEAYNFFDKIQVYFFALFGYGNEAVILFFVLSGFVIHYSNYNQYVKAQNSFSVKTYLFKRIKRIYPPIILAIILTFILDSIGKYYGYGIYEGHTHFALISRNIHSDFSLDTLLGNIFMVQTLYTSVWGSNSPLWSLMYEWWFYILYIPFFYVNRRNPLLAIGLVAGLFIISLLPDLAVFKWMKVINYFFPWYLGLITADIFMGRIKGRLTIACLLFFILSITFIAIQMRGMQMPVVPDLILAVFFALLIYTSLNYYQHLTALSILQPLSDFSYTLYVLHMPIIVLISGWLQHHYDGGLPMHFGYVYLSILLCMLVAWGAHFLVEKPFVRKK